jgi:hypothetical protein
MMAGRTVLQGQLNGLPADPGEIQSKEFRAVRQQVAKLELRRRVSEKDSIGFAEPIRQNE